MKFNKRFLMCLAIVGILLIPSIAKAGDAVATNKWMTEIPNGAEMVDAGEPVTAKVASVRGGGQSIKRNQKFYMAFYDVGGVTYTNNNGVSVLCTPNTDCASAPLFIASETVLICTDGNIASATADDGNSISVSICADSTCADVSSIVAAPALAEAPGTACGMAGQNSWVAQPNIGGQWIYVELAANPGNGELVLVWAVGQ